MYLRMDHKAHIMTYCRHICWQQQLIVFLLKRHDDGVRTMQFLYVTTKCSLIRDQHESLSILIIIAICFHQMIITT
ncbi:CLUMA_CG010294, isoform A [Clunio marinus]|uniref:CLUMA_CG010294, isoform A n=1 Tax=Clunio marinus TaxID=568069 RepID=A0A1J1I8D6_9DIPT|nr:CLUMA_CG010294, isoform A [Clunio marinus]